METATVASTRNVQFSADDQPYDGCFTFENRKGRKMFARHRLALVSKPVATIFWHHGMNGHQGSAAQFRVFERFPPLGFNIFSFDQVGHGRSATNDERGSVGDWNEFVQCSEDFIQHVLDKFPATQALPFFILGSSMGGGISIHLSLRLQEYLDYPYSYSGQPSFLEHLKKWKGSIFFAPAIDAAQKPSWIMHTVLSTLVLFGGGGLALGPAPQASHFLTQEHFNRYLSDPYSYSGKMRLSLASNVLAMSAEAREKIPAISFPFLVLHGDKDLSVGHTGSIHLIEASKTSSNLKKLILYDGAGHSLLEDPNSAPRIFEDCVDWMKSRLL